MKIETEQATVLLKLVEKQKADSACIIALAHYSESVESSSV